MTISDFEDGVKKGCISYYDIVGYKKQRNARVSTFKDHFKKYFEENRNDGEPLLNTITRMCDKLKSTLIVDCASSFCALASSWGVEMIPKKPSKHFNPLIENSSSYPIVKMLRDLVSQKVYGNEQIVAPELKGKAILSFLLEKMVDASLKGDVEDIVGFGAKKTESKYFRLMSKNFIEIFRRELDSDSFNDKEKTEVYYRMRLVIDEISGMTDSFAEEFYRKIN